VRLFAACNDFLSAPAIRECFGLPGGCFIDGLAGMGAKYLPTIKDLKASQRFQQKQKPLPQFKKSTGAQAKKSKKK